MSPTKKETHKQSGAKDRKTSSGNQYGREQNGTAEGNDPSHAAGKTITRKVPAKK